MWMLAATTANVASEAVEAAEGTITSAISWLDTALPVLIDFGWDVVKIILIFLIGSRVIQFLVGLGKNALQKTSLDEAVQMMVTQVLRVLLYLVLISMLFKTVGYETTSLVALIGSAGLSIGLGFQGSLSNFAGGVLLMVTKPFQIGDYILEDTGKNEGTVIHLGITCTTLKTADEKTVVVPNGNLANSSLTNFSTQGKRRLSITVGISYQDDLLKAKEVMRQVLEELPYRIQEEPVKVFVDELGESSVNLGGFVWVPASEYFPSKWEATEKVKLAFDANQIHIPYPQMDVHVKDGGKA